MLINIIEILIANSSDLNKFHIRKRHIMCICILLFKRQLHVKILLSQLILDEHFSSISWRKYRRKTSLVVATYFDYIKLLLYKNNFFQMNVLYAK